MDSTLYSCQKYPVFLSKVPCILVKSTLYSCPILMKLEFSRHILEKFTNIKLHKKPSSGSRVLSSGQTDGRTDAQT